MKACGSSDGFLIFMRKPWFSMFLAALVGVGAAWAINQRRFGTEARFGPFRSGMDAPLDAIEGLSPSAALTDDQPVAEVVGEAKHDFGIMAIGSTGQHTFVISNTGTAPLELRVGPSTCKCTVGELAVDRIEPGAETEVRLAWKAESDNAEFSQSALILTNDPLHTELRFQVTGKVVQDLEVVPAIWSFGEAAADEPLQVVGKIYNFMDHDIRPTELKFSDEELAPLAQFEVTPFDPAAETDGAYRVARQGFEVQVTISPGFRQGPFSRRFAFGFARIEAEDESIASDGSDEPPSPLFVPTSGRVVGALSMVENSRLRPLGESYLYDFGRIGENDDTKGRAFVVLKGSERDSTNLRIGKVSPEGTVQATLGEPRGSGSTILIPLEIELVPGPRPVRRLGTAKDDYGSVWIESDNPKVPKMRVALKFFLDGR